MKKPKVMVIFGTRPEAIKMAPVINHLQKAEHQFQTCVVVTAQHRSMLDQVTNVFGIHADHDLDIMVPDQTLADITVRAMSGLDAVLKLESPDIVLVQGDTTTAFVGGLAAYYRKIPIGHVEAGLRTHNKYNPFPEEVNRQLLDVLSDLCFAPTTTARDALRASGIAEDRILVTGNTVIDALLLAVVQLREFSSPDLRRIPFAGGRQTILVTAHRRESLGGAMRDVCLALRDLLTAFPRLQLVFPVHLNPKVRETVWSILGNMDRAWLTDPLDYLDFVHLLKASDLVVTDSGGIQEEAPALGKPVFVVRETTERPEAIQAGTARLVGTSCHDIFAAVSKVLNDPAEYAVMNRAVNPFGDGKAAARIVEAIRHHFGIRVTPPAPFWVEVAGSKLPQASSA